MKISFYRKSILLLMILVTSTISVDAQKTNPSSSNDTLLVGIAGSAPFVYEGNSGPQGIAIEIWEDVAVKKNRVYRYTTFESVETALGSLKEGALDLVVGPISITSKRLEDIRFSQPYYNSSLAIMSRAENPSLWEKVKPFFSIKLLMAVGVFLLILAIVGSLLWMVERKQSPDQFPYDPMHGIANGMWLAIVTMSTTGYGDKAPITFWGRIIAGAWMIISIIFATSMVAGIASSLTISSIGNTSITHIEQLADRKVATISGSPSTSFLEEHKIKVVGVHDLDEAVSMLKGKEVDAVVYDRPQILYYLKNKPDETLDIANAEYYKQGYGFAFQPNSELVYDVNRALLELTEAQLTERIISFYLDKKR